MSSPPPSTTAGRSSLRGRLPALLNAVAPAAALVLMCLILAALRPRFLEPANLSTVITRMGVIAILAMGETFVIIAGGIDLSVGSVVALAGVVAALSMTAQGVPVLPAALMGVAAGTLCGLLNGLLVTWGRLPSFIVTLGTMRICRGLAKMPSSATDISGLPDSFLELHTGRLLGGLVPTPVLIMLVIAVLAHVLMRQTRAGRYFYAMGSNIEAARLSGVNIRAYTTLVFVAGGTLAGVAGVLLAARLGVGQPTAGEGFELDAIAAAVIGGASLMGGVGTMPGTLIGALMMAVLRNGCNLLNFSTEWQDVTIGLVIILAVLWDKLRQPGRSVGLN